MNQEEFVGKIIGNFKIKKKIGEGAFSFVFLAEEIVFKQQNGTNDANLGQKQNKHEKFSKKKSKEKHYSACKIIPRQKIKEKKLTTRLDSEIRIHQLMHHPNIVQLLDIQSDQSYFYVFLEFCAGGELLEAIVQQHHFTEDRAAFLFRQILVGLQYIHSLKVSHRDLKPENILFDHFGRIKISDFGFSKIVDYNGYGLTRTPCGTPCYTSPECISGKPYDPRKSDLWSCGVILYVMTVGNFPWKKRTQKLLFKQIREAEFMIPDSISDTCADLICKFLTVDTSKRITIKQALNHPFFKDTIVPNFSFDWKYVSLRKVDLFFGVDEKFNSEDDDHLSTEKLGCESLYNLDFLKVRKNILTDEKKKYERLSSIVQSRKNVQTIRKKFDRKARKLSVKIEPIPPKNKTDDQNETRNSNNNGSFFIKRNIDLRLKPRISERFAPKNV